MGKAWLWAGDEGGCGWYRTVIVGEALRGLGHDVGAGVVMPDEYGDADAVLGQRMCAPGSTTRWCNWNFHRSKTTVFDADDDYFHMYQHPEFGSAAAEYSRTLIQSRLIGNAASASYTTCASWRLAQIFNTFCSNVVVVPNGLPEHYLDRPGPWTRWPDEPMPGAWDDHPGPGPVRRPDPYRPVVGWAGSAFTQGELTEPIREMLSKVGDWGGRLHTVGVPFSVMRRLGVARPGVSVTGWIEGSANYLDAIDFDIWVAPYRRTDYNDAKAPTKALEAAFLGIPVVASDTAPYRDFVQDGVTGFLIPPGGDWESPIRALIEDSAMRTRMGRAAREGAREFTIEKLAAQLWEPLLFGEAK